MTARPRMRPTFEIALTDDGSSVLGRLRDGLVQDDPPFVGQVLAEHAFVQLPRERRSLVSPYLNLRLVSRDGNPVLRGRFSPNPGVWMGFMAVFGTLGMVGLAGLMYGFAQMTIHETPWAFVVVPATLGLAAFVYGASVIGQGLSIDEMYEMRAFVDKVMMEPGSTSDCADDTGL